MKIEINIGDVIYTGRFKNKKETIKKFGKDDKGQPTVNGKKVLTFRMEKFMNKRDIKETMKKSELRRIIKEEIATPKTIVDEVKGISNREHAENLINMIRKYYKKYSKDADGIFMQTVKDAIKQLQTMK
jgi:hypothetical protein